MKILITKNKKYFWKGGDLHTADGTIKEQQIRTRTKVKTNLGKKFSVLPASFIDKIEKIKRGPAIILPKDTGLIITYTGLKSNDKVLDAGTGSGFLASYLSNIVGEKGKVYTYEKNKKFFQLAKKNFEFLDLKNIKLKNQNIAKAKEKNLDLAILDLHNPWQYLNTVKRTLKPGKFLVCYLPTITQVITLLKRLNKDFIFIRCVELLEREWKLEGRIVRPKSQMIAHTAFLVFLRKI